MAPLIIDTHTKVSLFKSMNNRSLVYDSLLLHGDLELFRGGGKGGGGGLGGVQSDPPKNLG